MKIFKELLNNMSKRQFLRMKQTLEEILFSEKFLDKGKLNSLINDPKWSIEDLEYLSKYASKKFKIMDELIKHDLKKRADQVNSAVSYN